MIQTFRANSVDNPDSTYDNQGFLKFQVSRQTGKFAVVFHLANMERVFLGRTYKQYFPSTKGTRPVPYEEHIPCLA